jgi:large subunit ribosomal protein LP1
MAAIYGASKDEFVTSMAALILSDGGAEVTSDNIKALLDGSNNSVAPYWPGLFASLLQGGNIDKLINSLGPSGAAPAAVAVGAADSGASAEEKKEEKKPKVEEVDALDGGMDMFGGSGGGGDY